VERSALQRRGQRLQSMTEKQKENPDARAGA